MLPNAVDDRPIAARDETGSSQVAGGGCEQIWWRALATLPSGHPDRKLARDSLVSVHLPLVRHLAARYRGRSENLDDLIQAGAIGLLNSIDRFDPDRGATFATFATPTILGEIRRHFRDKTWLIRVPRGLKEVSAAISQAREVLAGTVDHSPTVREIAVYLGVTEEQVVEGMSAANGYAAVGLDAAVDSESSVRATIEDRLGELDHALELVDMRQSVVPLLTALSERERRLIFLRYFQEKTQLEIAVELGISQMHVSRLLTQTVAKLHAELDARDVVSD